MKQDSWAKDLLKIFVGSAVGTAGTFTGIILVGLALKKKDEKTKK